MKTFEEGLAEGRELERERIAKIFDDQQALVKKQVKKRRGWKKRMGRIHVRWLSIAAYKIRKDNS